MAVVRSGIGSQFFPPRQKATRGSDCGPLRADLLAQEGLEGVRHLSDRGKTITPNNGQEFYGPVEIAKG